MREQVWRERAEFDVEAMVPAIRRLGSRKQDDDWKRAVEDARASYDGANESCRQAAQSLPYPATLELVEAVGPLIASLEFFAELDSWADFKQRVEEAMPYVERLLVPARAEHHYAACCDRTTKSIGRGTADGPTGEAKPEAEAGKPEKGEGKDSERTPNDSEETSSFNFAPDGDTYFISGFGESGHVSKLKGFDTIGRLLKTPGVLVPMAELIGIDNNQRFATDHRSRQESLDPQARTKLQARLNELVAERTKAEIENDTLALEEINQERQAIESRYQADIGFAGRSRDINSEIEKLRPRIHGVLKRAYKTLRSGKQPMNELADHLEAAISSEGRAFVYRPPMPVKWTFCVPRKK